jgi:hypothetical protein
VHTSSEIDLTDFVFQRAEHCGAESFPTFCTDYHIRDRVAVISTYWEEGIIGAGRSLLALTAAFYQSLRTRGTPFFDYPQHFAVLGSKGDKVRTREGLSFLNRTEASVPWSALDVWPESQWRLCTPEPSVLLYEVFTLQINRLFWPEHLHPSAVNQKLPQHVRQLLCARLQSVYYYEAAEPNFEIGTLRAANRIWRQSLEHIGAEPTDLGPVDRLRRVSPEQFLDDFDAYFVNG